MNIMFRVILNNSCIDGLPKYSLRENALSFEPWGKASFSIMLGAAYTSLDISADDGIAYHISGYNPNKLWITKKLIIPNAQKGHLQILSNEIFPKGCGMDYQHGWSTYYDAETGWLCIGDYDVLLTSLNVEFCTDTIAVIENSELKGVWIKPAVFK